ncbi:MAG: dTMP kinase, partial [Actinomycetota bacterium]|nr:dTMP kinase [Actinomycetota bacterium]
MGPCPPSRASTVSLPDRPAGEYAHHACRPPPTCPETAIAKQDDADRPTAGDTEGVGSLVAGGARLSTYADLLANRNYRRWFSASLASSLGDWVGLVALQALVITLSPPGSRAGLFALGGIMMARLLPSILIGPVAGVLADRYDRKRLMVFTDLARGGLFVGIAFSDELTSLFALTFAVECLSLLYMSAKDSSLPTIVARRQLTEANQLNLLLSYGTLPLGAVIATAITALLRLAGVPPHETTAVALLVDAGTFFLGAALMAGLQLPAHGRHGEREEGPGVLAELREGVDFIRGLPLVRSLILGVVGVFFGAGVVVTLGPEFVRSDLGRPPTDWYTLMTAVGVGLVVGILLVPVLTQRFSQERLLPVTMAATGGIAAIIATLPNFPLTLAFGLVLGAAAGLSFVMGYTLLHEKTPDETRGRTFAAFYTGTRISLFTSLGVAPFLAGAIGRGTLILGDWAVTMSGIRITILAGGCTALLSALSAGRGMNRTLEGEPEPRAVSVTTAEPGPRPSGVFIAFEGGEGAGKSTQVKALVSALEAEGHQVVVTREPGGSPVAERIRSVLLEPSPDGMQPRTEALLCAAARAEHVQQVIRPALDEGRIVVCDRFLDSSLAYQGFARGLGDGDVLEINRWATGGLLPDVVVLLHLDPEEGLRRVAERARRRARDRSQGKARGGGSGALLSLGQRGPDRIESQDVEFHRRVAEGYMQLAKRDRDRFVVIDASADAGTVARQVRSRLQAWLPPPPEGPPEASGP